MSARFSRALFNLRKNQLGLLSHDNYSGVDDVPLFELAVQKHAFAKEFRPVVLKAAQTAHADMLATIDAAKGARATRATVEEAEISRLTEDVTVSVSRSVSTIRKQIRSKLEQVFAGRTPVEKAEIVDAIKNVFNGAAGRKGMIATLASGASINGARHIAMRQREVQQNAWLTAADELVRDHHVSYEVAGPQNIGFNWASIVGEGYVLEYPLDTRAPLSEIANCRCALVPTLE